MKVPLLPVTTVKGLVELTSIQIGAWQHWSLGSVTSLQPGLGAG